MKVGVMHETAPSYFYRSLNWGSGNEKMWHHTSFALFLHVTYYVNTR